MSVSNRPNIPPKNSSLKNRNVISGSKAKKEVFPEHDLYTKLKDRWIFYLLSFEGGEDYTEGKINFLYKHSREHADDFKFRKDRAIFESLSQTIINHYASHISRKGIERIDDKGNEDYKRFIINVDGEGHSMDHYMLNRVFPATQTFGFSYVVPDMPVNNEGEIISEADRKAGGIFPYLTTYYPLNAINWQITRGKWDWIVFTEENYQNIDNPLTLRRSAAQQLEKIYKLWTKDEWATFNGKGAEISRGKNPFNEVPVALFHNRESLIYPLPIGLSCIKTIAEIDRKIYNLGSLLDEFMYRQAFPQLVLDKKMLGKIIESGTTSVLPAEADGIIPTFVQPKTDGAKFITDEINRLIQSAYRYAQIRDTNATGGNPESGVSKAYDLHDSNQNIAHKSINMETGENMIHRLLEPFNGEVIAQYPREFDIKTLNEELAETMEVMKADLGSITYAREKAFNLIQKDLQKAEPKLLERIKEELDNVDPSLSVEDTVKLIQLNVLGADQVLKKYAPELTDQQIKDRVVETKEINVSPGEQTPPTPSIEELIG